MKEQLSQLLQTSCPFWFPKENSTGVRNRGGRSEKYPALWHAYYNILQYRSDRNWWWTSEIRRITLSRWKSSTSMSYIVTYSEIRRMKTLNVRKKNTSSFWINAVVPSRIRWSWKMCGGGTSLWRLSSSLCPPQLSTNSADYGDRFADFK